MERQIDLKEHQQIMLEILKDFASFCDEHGLTYFLDAGTLLGAVRHKGFIPWDDDVDVCMPRKDFDRFIVLMQDSNNYLNDHIILEKPCDTIYTFYKLGDIRTRLIEFKNKYPLDCHVYIDIFPKDGILNKRVFSKAICDKSGRLALRHWFYKYSINYWKTKKKGLKRLIAILFDKIVKNKNRALIKQTLLIKKYNSKHPYESCSFVTTLVNGEFNGLCPIECFDDYIMLDFENCKFKCPIGYETWLSILYGKNYMDLPPLDQRRSHNNYVEWR